MKLRNILLILVPIYFYLPIFAQPIDQCLKCGIYLHGEVVEKTIGKVKSIKTFSSIEYQHYLSSFDKEHELWQKYSSSPKDTIISLGDEPKLIEEIYKTDFDKIAAQLKYDEKGNTIYKATFVFDSLGFPIESEIYNKIKNEIVKSKVISKNELNNAVEYIETGIDNKVSTFSIDYFEDQKTIKLITKTIENKTQYQNHKYNYDSNGNLILHEIIDSNKISGFTPINKLTISSKYDGNGCLIESKKTNQFFKQPVLELYSYEYDNNYCLNKIIVYGTSKNDISSIIELNENMSRKSESKFYNSNGSKLQVDLKYTYKFDNVGNWIRLEIGDISQKLKDLVVYTREIEYY